MKTRLTLTLLASGPLALAFAACSSDVSDAPTKAEVAQAVGAGEPVDDNVCSDNGWTGDGECDAWCPGGDDGDCSGEDIVCAAFVEANDGVCGRPADDPCKHQDPDCEIECPAIALVRDGT